MGQHWCRRAEKKVIYICFFSETWKAVKGCWAGSFEDNGKCRCGVVIKGDDRERWVTISRIAVPLEVGTAVAAEVAGVCVSVSVSTVFSISNDVKIVELVFCKMLTPQKHPQTCIDHLEGRLHAQAAHRSPTARNT